MTDDLVAASQRLEAAELLTILCRVGGAPPELDMFTVNLQAALATELGGALTSLNARVVRWLISFGTAELTRVTVKRYVSRLSERCTVRPTPNRIRMTDVEVAKLIKKEQRLAPRSRSALLRVLRDKGYAVEQSRFGKIYCEVTEATSVG